MCCTLRSRRRACSSGGVRSTQNSGSSFAPTRESRHAHDAQRAREEALLHRHDFAGMDLARRLRHEVVHGHTPCPARIGRERPGLEDAHRPEPFVEAVGDGGGRRAQGRKAKSAGGEVNSPARACGTGLLTRVQPVSRVGRPVPRRGRTQFFRTRGKSARSQSSSSAFSWRTVSSRKPIVIFIRNARSRSSRLPSFTTLPSALVSRNESFTVGG